MATTAEIAATLLCFDSHWVSRRKHVVSLLDDRTVRHELSVDFAIPASIDDLDLSFPCSAPLFSLRKAPAELTRFDFVGRGGETLTLPTRAENARLSAEILLELAVRAAAKEGVTRERVLTEVGPRIEDIAKLDILDASTVRQHLLYGGGQPEDIRDALAEDDTFVWASELFEANCIVGLPVESQMDRQIVKLGYDESQLYLPGSTWSVSRQGFGWEGYMLWLELPLVTSGSYHFEVTAPPGLEIIDCGVALKTDGGTLFKRGLALRQRTHVYLRGAYSYRSALGWALVRVYRGGFITGAVASTTVVVIALAGGAILAPEIAKVPGGVPALLLLFPSALVALVSRPGRHEVTLRLLHHARWLLMGVALIAFAAAARVALLPGEHEGELGVSVSTLRWEFIGATALASVALVALFFTWLLPRGWRPQATPGVYIEPVASSGSVQLPGGRVKHTVARLQALWLRVRPRLDTGENQSSEDSNGDGHDPPDGSG